MVACLFLVHNGFAFAASDVEAVTGIVALAAGEMDRRPPMPGSGDIYDRYRNHNPGFMRSV
jgi:prophage maintenance system killer protein